VNGPFIRRLAKEFLAALLIEAAARLSPPATPTRAPRKTKDKAP
jgi:hypothetical protein